VGGTVITILYNEVNESQRQVGGVLEDPHPTIAIGELKN
jgi:hypothetical protein